MFIVLKWLLYMFVAGILCASTLGVAKSRIVKIGKNNYSRLPLKYALF